MDGGIDRSTWNSFQRISSPSTSFFFDDTACLHLVAASPAVEVLLPLLSFLLPFLFSLIPAAFIKLYPVMEEEERNST